MRKPANNEMLILARESRGMSQSDLAERAEITQASVSKFESGIIEIPDERVEALAEALGYPVGFFYREGSRRGFASPHLYKRKREMPMKQLRAIEATTNVRALEVASLLRGVEIETDVYFDRLDVDEFDSPEDIARMVRARWRLPMGPIQNLVRAVESAGGIVVVSDFGTRKLDAISQWMPDHKRPLFFINSDSPGDRLRFSLAHEIGHVTMHEVRSEDPEGEADRFAAELLMPAKEIKSDLRSLSMQKLGSLKYYWKVSMAALVMQARNLGQMTDAQYRRFWTKMGKLGYRTKEPNPIPREEPSVVKDVIDLYRYHHKYSVSDLSRMTHLHAHEFGHLYLQRDQPHLRLVD
ncbi:MAG: XRE family transcriptional regulator [Actinomycetota bacterium]|nr:XRE family transcriptional regulator [Actinomycetota bacterium]